MVQISLKGKSIHTLGSFPALHTKVPDFTLVDKNLKKISLHDFDGKKKLIATVPSIDTEVCGIMTKHINEFGKKHPDYILLVISADLPFAQKRFCQTEQVQNLQVLSTMGNDQFGKTYGLTMADGPIQGLLARALLILDEKNHLIYAELVSEISEEPDYHKAFEALKR